MYNWHAKVHKSGLKVAVFNGSKFVKFVESSKKTFEPAEAQKFAEELVSELKGRTSAQMTQPSEQPTVATTNELANATLEAVTTQAKDQGAGRDSLLASEVIFEENDDEENDDEEKLANLHNLVANLKKKLVQERNDRVIERKARRGLAIAKQLVVSGKLEDSYEEIKTKIAQVVKLEDSEIDRVERKIAGENEFVTIEDAQKELRRQARIARINRQAAAEAQEDGDESEAENLDSKADIADSKVSHVEQVIEDMSKVADDDAKETPTEDAKEAPAEDAKETSTEDAKEAPAEDAKETSTEDAKEDAKEAASEVPSPSANKAKAEDSDDKPQVNSGAPAETAASDSSDVKLAELARSYRVIASNHRKLAEVAEVAGDISTADAQDAMGDQAEEKAEDIEKKLAERTEEKRDEKDLEVKEPSEASTEEEHTEEENKQPGGTVTSSKHTPLKRKGKDSVIEESSFGVDKNASLVEENDFSGDSEVEVLSRMWRGAPQDE